MSRMRVLYGAVVSRGEAGAVADRGIGNRIINSPYPAVPLSLRLDRRAIYTYPGKLLQAGGSRADAENTTMEPVAVSIGPQCGTVGPFRPPGAAGTRWSAPLAWERGMAPCVAGLEGKDHA